MLDAYIIQKREEDAAEQARKDRQSWTNQPRVGDDERGRRRAWEDRNPDSEGGSPTSVTIDFTLKL